MGGSSCGLVGILDLFFLKAVHRNLSNPGKN